MVSFRQVSGSGTMRRTATHISIAGVLLSSVTICSAQRSDEPPGSMKLLPGYTHDRLRGVDTRTGRITKTGGLAIRYDIGHLAGNFAESNKHGAAWFKEQSVKGQTLQLAFTKDKG